MACSVRFSSVLWLALATSLGSPCIAHAQLGFNEQNTLSPWQVQTPAPSTAISVDSKPVPHAIEEAIDVMPETTSPVRTVDLTSAPDDIWQRIRLGFGMPDLNNDLVTERQVWYLSRPSVLKSLLNRGRRYLYYIVDELERRGMPTELALLPMVESAYNPMAYSRAHASGLWQFIPSTGRSYNLTQNSWVDERRDIIASTKAALDYLQNIYEMHGDWHLALASYNWGEGAVGRALQKNQAAGRPMEYQYLNMPGETRYYVPKLQALKNIISRPELFNLALPEIPNRPYFSTVDLPSQIDLVTAARLAETPLEEFVALNPAHKRPVIRGGENGLSVVVPSDKVNTFLSNLENLEPSDKGMRTYTLQPGEKIDQVAKRFNVPLPRLLQANSLSRYSFVTAGDTLVIPNSKTPDLTPLENLPQFRAPAVAEPPKTKTVYVIKNGKKVAVKVEVAPSHAKDKAHPDKASTHASASSAKDKTGKVAPLKEAGKASSTANAKSATSNKSSASKSSASKPSSKPAGTVKATSSGTSKKPASDSKHATDKKKK